MRSRNFSYMLLNQLKMSGVCQAIIKAARPVNGNQTRPFKNGSSLGVTNSNAFGDQAWNADEWRGPDGDWGKLDSSCISPGSSHYSDPANCGPGKSGISIIKSSVMKSQISGVPNLNKERNHSVSVRVWSDKQDHSERDEYRIFNRD